MIAARNKIFRDKCNEYVHLSLKTAYMSEILKDPNTQKGVPWPRTGRQRRYHVMRPHMGLRIHCGPPQIQECFFTEEICLLAFDSVKCEGLTGATRF